MIQIIKNQSVVNVAKMLQNCCKTVANRGFVAETFRCKKVSATFGLFWAMLQTACNILNHCHSITYKGFL